LKRKDIDVKETSKYTINYERKAIQSVAVKLMLVLDGQAG